MHRNGRTSRRWAASRFAVASGVLGLLVIVGCAGSGGSGSVGEPASAEDDAGSSDVVPGDGGVGGAALDVVASDAPGDVGPPGGGVDAGPEDGGEAFAADAGRDVSPADVGPGDRDAEGVGAAAACLHRTRDEGECKDCCDCLQAACEAVVACRDECPHHDFSQNGDFVEVVVPSELGPEGDYSVCTSAGTEQDCKACCDCAGRFLCGDQKHCRDACVGSAARWPSLRMERIGPPVLVADTFLFAEGPAWDATAGVLLFSDIEADTIYELALPDTLSVLRSPSERANGLAFDPDGRLIVAEHASRSVTRTLADGTRETVADAWEGRRLNSPNDVVVRSDGTIFFTDPTYGLGEQASDLGFTGLWRVAPSGALSLEARIEGAPNGVVLLPREATLLVAATQADEVLAFDVAPDGSTSGARRYLAVDAPDGMAVDAGGNLYVAAMDGGGGAVVVVDRERRRLGAIPLPHAPTNCGFGGPDRKTLFVTARQALYRVAVPIPGP